MVVPSFVKSIKGVSAVILVVLLAVAGAVFRPFQGLLWLAAGIIAVIGVINTLSYGG